MINNHTLRSYVSAQIDAATGTLNSDIATHRAELYDRYLGETYGDEVEGRSQVVMSDISDTVEWIMPELMDIFTAGDDVVEFEPQGPEDEPAAKQETAVVNYVIGKNDGFLLLYTWFKDALIQKNGIIKQWWDQREVEQIEEYENLSADEVLVVLSQLADEGDIEILEQTWDTEDPEGDSLGLKVRVTKKVDEYKVQSIPPEEFMIHPKHNSIFLDGCPFVGHKSTKTVSELIQMGFDRKQVETLPDDDDYMDQEEIERFSAEDNAEYSEGQEPDPSMREVALYECYIYLDRNEDGIAELLQVYMGGEHNELMKWADGGVAVEEVDQQPFDAITPVLLCHKFFGRSVAELVEDLQRIRTVLVRQMLDNVYLGNNARPHIDMDRATDTTIKDVLNAQVGYPIRGRGPDAGVSYPSQPQNYTPAILQAVEYVDHLRENRTGVTKYNQGLDANSLNKTATGIRSIMSASQKKILLIARIFAETGVKSAMRRMHRNLRKGPVKEIAAKLQNEWIQVNPRLWADRADMSVSVGLGTGDKNEQLMRLDAILERQIQGLEAGLATREQILHTLHKMIETAGFKSPEMFFSLGEAPQQQQGPDPALQAMMQVEQMKAQAKAQETQLKVQADMASDQAKIELEREKLRAQLEADRQKVADELEHKRSELLAEAAAQDEDIAIKKAEIDLKARELEIKAQEARAKIGEMGARVDTMRTENRPE